MPDSAWQCLDRKRGRMANAKPNTLPCPFRQLNPSTLPLHPQVPCPGPACRSCVVISGAVPWNLETGPAAAYQGVPMAPRVSWRAVACSGGLRWSEMPLNIQEDPSFTTWKQPILPFSCRESRAVAVAVAVAVTSLILRICSGFFWSRTNHKQPEINDFEKG